MMLEPPSILAVQAITIALLERGRLDGKRIAAIDATARAQPIPTTVADAVAVLFPNIVLHGNHKLPLWARVPQGNGHAAEPQVLSVPHPYRGLNQACLAATAAPRLVGSPGTMLA